MPSMAIPRPGTEPVPPDFSLSRPARIASRLLLIRHGESTWNREGRIQGQLDPPLSALGLDQARELASKLAGQPLQAVYASDLQRAHQTAVPIAAALGLEVIVKPELREIGLGEWEGKTGTEVQAQSPALWQAWSEQPSWDLIPGCEGKVPFEARVRSFLDQVFAAHPEGEILCVAHGGVIQVMLGVALRLPLDGHFPFVITNGSLTALGNTDKGLVIMSVNEACRRL
jgi:2,3-bisphosphoglycerate-dependent phosphoglycerate mutase